MSWWLDISDLDEDQKSVIELPSDGRYLLLGPPGSGKTNLLLIRAEYLIRSGVPNVFVLMFNQPLHEFVTRGGAHYDVPKEKIKKIMSWQLVLLREHGIELEEDESNDLDSRRRQISTRLLELIDSNTVLENHVECLFVDEIQDCLKEEVQVFMRCAKSLCFAGDNRQRIYSPESQIEQLKNTMEVVTISTHYRVGHEICTAADAIAKAAGLEAIGSTCNYSGPPSNVSFLSCASDEEQIEKIISSLKIQLAAFPGELLCVAAPRVEDRDWLMARLLESDVADNVLPHRVSGDEINSKSIYVANLREIKGLEFRTIHLALMEKISSLGKNQKRIAYTAVTRAKTTVTVYYTGKIPGYLEQAMVAVEPPKAKPVLKDLFPPKGGASK